MKWVNHQLVTTTAMLAATGNPFFAILTGGLSLLPDKIDFLCGGLGRMPFHLFHHRQHSHYWLYWVILAVSSYSYMESNVLMLGSFSDYVRISLGAIHGGTESAAQYLIPNLLFWASIGSLFHIFEDFFSGMGVPLLFPTKLSPHIQIYTGGKISEYLVSFVVSMTCLYSYLMPSLAQKSMWYAFTLRFF